MRTRESEQSKQERLLRVPKPTNHAGRWHAVQTRNQEADGKFVYAVRSTGIYCRPSCAARKPARQQVVFFPTPEAAEQSGFRACRRCLPRRVLLLNTKARLVARVCRKIDSELNLELAAGDGVGGGLTLATLGASERISVYRLERVFRSVIGITPLQYAHASRFRRLKTHLRKGNNVTDSLYEVGFSSSSRVYEQAHARLGMTPDTYRRGGAGMKIRYTIADSPLGYVLIGATERGISAIYMGDSAASLEAALRREYPRANITKESNDRLAAWARKIVAHLRGQHPHLDLPRDIQATAFQIRVWEELRRIPPGITRTYSEVAQAIGKPTAIRAVAHACATNPVSLVVPCHRVVRKGGNLAGYRWGIARKQALLELESQSAERQNSKS